MSSAEWERGAFFGIVNVTRDSFSDGGRYLEPARAIEQARLLHRCGAAVIDLGACSSHPDSEQVSPAEEIRRLAPVIPTLLSEGIAVCVDSHAPEVQLWAMDLGVQLLNDIHGFPNEELYPALRRYPGRLVVMHSVQTSGPAARTATAAADIMGRVRGFFSARIQELERGGVARERMILDPGMGFFLGTEADVSISVLRSLPQLKSDFGLPLLISVSRKSFVGALTGRSVSERGAGTLAAELFALDCGADYIRTHDVAALRDAYCVWRALKTHRDPETQRP